MFQVVPNKPVAFAMRDALTSSVDFFRQNEPLAKSGHPVGVHHLRTTTRRLRTILDLFRDLADKSLSDPIADELKILAALLGRVRDLDVLKGRILGVADKIAAVEALQPVFEALDEQHRRATLLLSDEFASDRYQRLVVCLADAVERLPATVETTDPCRKVLPGLVEETWKRLRKHARDLSPDDPDEAFHEVRKYAKRARYAAEAVKDALDSESKQAAKAFAKRAGLVQEVLGEHQDAVVAADFLEATAQAHADLGRFGFAAGRLLERERRAAEAGKDRFFEVFPRIDRKKVVRWLHP